MKWHKVFHYFIPHPQTHQKAHLLSWHYLLIYVLLFAILRVGFNLVDIYKPGILGVNSNINVEEIIQKVNIERQNKGLASLKQNQALDAAALAKATNMFEENYWAHFSPSGKDPWKFILGAGYKFSFAGENLAKNFYNSNDVVKAWMNSSSHRENILNPNYQDIGIAVVDGVLQGQKTTLVVQMFGRPYEALAFSQTVPTPTVVIQIGKEKISLAPSEIEQERPVLVAGSSLENLPGIKPASLDPYLVSRIAGLVIMSLISFLLIMDFVILKKRGVFRISSHHFIHLSFIAIVGAAVLLGKVGGIL